MNKPIQRKYHLINAEGKAPGRISTEAALILRGKNKVDFAPHIDAGDIVVVINTNKLYLSGRKADKKLYHHFSGYPGGITTIRLKDIMKHDSRQVVKRAVYGMLPKNKLRNKMIKRLHLYRDAKHAHKIDVTH